MLTYKIVLWYFNSNSVVDHPEGPPSLEQCRLHRRIGLILFQTSAYELYHWLTATEERYKLYCWECLLFASDRLGVWSHRGLATLTYLTKARGHLQAGVLLRTFGDARVDLQLDERVRRETELRNDMVKYVIRWIWILNCSRWCVCHSLCGCSVEDWSCLNWVSCFSKNSNHPQYLKYLFLCNATPCYTAFFYRIDGFYNYPTEGAATKCTSRHSVMQTVILVNALLCLAQLSGRWRHRNTFRLSTNSHTYTNISVLFFFLVCLLVEKLHLLGASGQSNVKTQHTQYKSGSKGCNLTSCRGSILPLPRLEEH